MNKQGCTCGAFGCGAASDNSPNAWFDMAAGRSPKKEVNAVVARTAVVTLGGMRFKSWESAMAAAAPENASGPSATPLSTWGNMMAIEKYCRDAIDT
jgi:hypothetical protein